MRKISTSDVIASFWSLLRALVHPVTLVSLFGPFFLAINLNWLIRLTNVSSLAGPSAQPLKQVLEDPWVFALADYLIQSYTLVLAVTLFGVAFIGALFARQLKVGLAGIGGDVGAVALIVPVAVAAIVLLVTLTNGVFGSPGVVALYLPEGGNFWGVMRAPPPSSPLTIGRVVVGLLGMALSVYQRHHR